MCLVAFAAAQRDRFPWVLASNRDEFFDRPTLPMEWWTPRSGGSSILSGRDAQAGGTWLGLDHRGRLALVTNVRSDDPAAVLTDVATRGSLVPDWLMAADVDAERMVFDDMAKVPRNGFNFVAADMLASDGVWQTNRPESRRQGVSAGVWGLSNAGLQTPWPKVVTLRDRLSDVLSTADSVPALTGALFNALADPGGGASCAADKDEPSAAFIRVTGDDGRLYGTRCSTIVIVESTLSGPMIHIVERTFNPDATVAGQVTEHFAVSEARPGS